MYYKVLVIEDNKNMREIINDYFTATGFSVDLAEDGKIALEMLDENKYDAVLLDVMMPNLDGYTVCRHIRRSKPLKASSNIPILFITALGQEEDVLKGYALGADDYIVKPFSLPVLVAKVKQTIKRSLGMPIGANEINYSGLSLNINSKIVKVNNEEINLASKQYEILLYLMRNHGIVLSREQILDEVWGMDYAGNDRVVDTQIKILRAALGEKAYLINTVFKTGYVFKVGDEYEK